MTVAPERPVLLGRTMPRLFTPPLVKGRPGPCGCGCALTPKTSLGFSAVKFAEDVLGISLFPWQRWLLIHAMELRRDGRFRFRTVLVLVARQNGKTTLVEVKNLWKMFVLRVRMVINTAQNLDVSEESWDNGVAMVESIPELAEEMDGDPIQRNGKKTLKLVGGSRWKVATASRKGGRGLSGDDVNLDELREHQTWDAWGAVTKTTLAVGRPPGRQVWAYSNAGDDKSVVLNDLQAKGRLAAEYPEAADPFLGFFEWSSPDGCPMHDESHWPWSNPSMGYPDGVDVEGLRAALGTDPEPVFRTECLCQHVPNMAPTWGVVSHDAWSAVLDADSTVDRSPGRVVFAAEVAWDRSAAAIGVAGWRPDGLAHVELTTDAAGQVDYRTGSTSWVPGRLKELVDQWKPAAVVMNGKGPAGSLVADVEKLGIEVRQPTFVEIGQAFGRFVDAVSERTLRHPGDKALNDALAGAAKRKMGDAAVYDMKETVTDSAPMVTVILALHGLMTAPAPQKFFASYR